MSAVAETTHSEHTHHKHQAHHFHDMEQQRAAAKMGTWLFLGQELLFFGGIFMAYIFLRYSYPLMMLESSHHLDVVLGTTNTVVLLTSSLTMVLGVRAAKLGDNKAVTRWVVLTILLACTFLVIKGFEYNAKFAHGLLPANFWDGDVTGVSLQAGQPGPWLFFGLYFGATGLHAIHVIIGIGLLIWVALRSSRNEFDSEHYAVVDNVGLYWHLVDLIWIFLFPLFYLVA